MAIKALKQSVSISETQKMIHQWKRRGVNDPTITKLLDLYLGMPAYMNSQGIYPLCNFYDLRLSLRFSYTSALVAAVTNCQSFGIAHWINSYYHLPKEKWVDKNSDLVKKIKVWVDAQYEDGRVTVLTDSELVEEIGKCCKELNITI